VRENGRSPELAEETFLRRAELAADAEAELFARNPAGSGRYAGRLLARALCEGAALHYVDMHNGVKDFDVWSFYAQHNDWPFPPRWRGTRDFGPSKFGRYPGDPARYSGRRVDLLRRSLPAAPGTDARSCRSQSVGIAGLAWLVVGRGAVNLDVRDPVISGDMGRYLRGSAVAGGTRPRFGLPRLCGHSARCPTRRTLR